MIAELCPAREQLREFTQGLLPPGDLETIAEHLEMCDTCERAVSVIEGDADSFMAALKCPAGQESFVAEPEFQLAAPRIEAIGCRSERMPGEPVNDPTARDAGRTIGQYRLVEKIGSGGMGAVYKALHSRLEKYVAVKILRTRRTLDAHAVARFEREMRAVGKLHHENIVQASDAGEADGRQYLVMEYLEGADASELIRRRGRLSAADACELIRQAAIGLHHAHEHGLVHRDLKPSNLMLTTDGRVKLLDLGLARFVDERLVDAGLDEFSEESSSDLTVTGHVMGTAEYMAPEQAANSRDVDIRADIYSLGCALFALLAGEPPFSRSDYDSPVGIMWAHRRKAPSSIDDHVQGLPPGLGAVVQRMLAKDPDDRFCTPMELAHALAPFATGADLTALFAPASKVQARDMGKPLPRSPWTAARWAGAWKAAVLVALVIGLIAAMAVPVVVNLSNRYGTIVVETDDENVQLVVMKGGEEVELINAQSGWTIKIKEGEYHVKLQGAKEKFELKDKSITVTSGGRVKVRVTLKKAGPDQAGLNLPLDERQAAVQRLRAIGAELTEKEGVVTDLGLSFSSKVTDADLAALDGLPELKTLALISCPNITDAGLAHLKGHTQLEQLNLSACNLGDAGLEHVKGLQNLSVLNLNGTRVTDAGMKNLIDNRKIAVLYLNGTRITDAGLAFLEQMKDMYWLDLNGTEVTDAGLARLGHLSNMKLLHLDRTAVTDAGLARLGHMSKLQLLALNGTAVTDAGMADVAKLTSIERLLLSDTRVTDAGLIHLAKLPHLKELQLLNTHVTQSGVDAVRRELPGCEITFGVVAPPRVTPTAPPAREVGSLAVTIEDGTLPCGVGRVKKDAIWNEPYRYVFRAFPDYLANAQHIFMRQNGGGAAGRWLETGQVQVSRPCWFFAAVHEPTAAQRETWRKEGWEILPDVLEDLGDPRFLPRQVRKYMLMRTRIDAGPVNFDTKATKSPMVIWMFQELDPARSAGAIKQPPPPTRR